MKFNIGNLVQLKETAEIRILAVIKNLENLQNAYGIDNIQEAIDLLHDIRPALLVDLDGLNKEENKD